MRPFLVMAAFMCIMGIMTSHALALVPNPKEVAHVEAQLAKYVPARIAADPRLISARDAKLIAKLVEAARLMDDIFLRQVGEENPQLRASLAADPSPNAKTLLAYFDRNAGPFDRLDEHKAFLKIPESVQPPTAGFYPPDLTKKEWDAWLGAHPEVRKEFESTVTVIRREGDALKAMPYSTQYAEWLKPAAALLREAAALTSNKSLATYLTHRADAFASNDYYPSDVDWMKLKDHTVEVVIGPYEVYEDRFMGYKAAFEAFVTVVDTEETAKLAKFEAMMDEFEKNLPMEDAYRTSKRGAMSPIVVAQLVYAAGESKAGVQTLAFNLPNDERVREALGTKKVMLKNVSHAKFAAILTPIARLTMSAKDAADISFDAFFNHTLMHEISHGVGPGTITVDGRESTVNKELKDLYSIVEEAKADSVGLYNNLYLVDKGTYPKGADRALVTTYLAGLFRSMRFGIAEAHGGANAIQFNYLKDHGGIVYDAAAKKFGVNEEKMREAIRALAHDILMIEAAGDYAGAKKFIAQYQTMPAALKDALSGLSDVPVDIAPQYEFFLGTRSRF